MHSAASSSDSYLKAAPIWNSFAMMCATYTLYQAPFWVSKLHQNHGDSMVATNIVPIASRHSTQQLLRF